jgi:hypothetical protein
MKNSTPKYTLILDFNVVLMNLDAPSTIYDVLCNAAFGSVCLHPKAAPILSSWPTEKQAAPSRSPRNGLPGVVY